MNVTIPNTGEGNLLNTVTAHAALTDAHSAAVTAQPNRLILRDGAGRAHVESPLAPADIARLDTVTATQVGLGNVTNESKITMFTNPTFTGNVGIGTAVPTSTLDVRGESNRFSNYTGMKEFILGTPHGIANQKIDLFMTSAQVFKGVIKVSISGSWDFMAAIGTITKTFGLDVVANGVINMQHSRYTEVVGVTPETIAIADLVWDSINSRYRITIANRTANGIQLALKITYFATQLDHANNAATFTMSSIYTTDPTVFPRPEVSFQHRVGIGITEPTTQLDISGDGMRIRTPRTPASATAPGNVGDICWDAGFVYVCTATNTWRRSALTAW